MDVHEFKNLAVGDTIVSKMDRKSYVVTGSYYSRATAVRSVDITKPDEWYIESAVQPGKARSSVDKQRHERLLDALQKLYSATENNINTHSALVNARAVIVAEKACASVCPVCGRRDDNT